MNTRRITRLLGLVCLFGLSSGLIAYTSVGVRHQVGDDQVGEVTFTHLSHSGAVQRTDNGRFTYADWYQPEETKAAKAVPAVQEDTTEVKTVNVAQAKSETKPAAKKPEPAKVASKAPAAKKAPATTTKKPAATKPKPAAPGKTPAKKPETKKPAEKAPEPDKKPAAKPACPT